MGATIGIAVGCGAALCLLIAVIVFAVRRFNERAETADAEMQSAASMRDNSSNEYAKITVNEASPEGVYAGAPANPVSNDYGPAPPTMRLGGEYSSPPPLSTTVSVGATGDYGVAPPAHYESVHTRLD